MLRKRNIKLIVKFRYLLIEDLPQESLIKNSSIYVESLENQSEELKADEYLLCIVKIVKKMVRKLVL